MSDSVEIIPDVGPVREAGEIADAAETVAGFANTLHIDIDDGIFTPNISWPYLERGEYMHFAMIARKPRVEMHLMVQNPRDIGCLAAHAGAYRIIAQIESIDPKDAKVLFEDWKGAGAEEIGISILLNTPISALESIVELCDVVQVMSIAQVGLQGAPFDARALAKVADIHALYPKALIAVDGGVSLGDIEELARVGARRFAVGSHLLKTSDPESAYKNLKFAAESAIQ